MSMIRVRRLDENWDPVFGGGTNSYLTDLEAVTQIIQSRLWLWLGEWWENTKEGLPMWQSILGQVGVTKDVVDKIIQNRIATTPYVKSVIINSNLVNRTYTCTATVETDFGTVVITNQGG